MKATFTIGLLLLTFCLSAPAHANSKNCKVSTNDVGLIVGHGKTDSKAFEDAATQCYEKRTKRFKILKGKDVDEDSGVAMIDACANIRCEG